MIEGTTSKGQGNLPGTTVRDREVETGSPFIGTNHGLLSSLSKSTREILITEKVARSLEQPPRMWEASDHETCPSFAIFTKTMGMTLTIVDN
ncbi:hypothetical protein Tco_0350728 [Tanacetum coccineum]